MSMPSKTIQLVARVPPTLLGGGVHVQQQLVSQQSLRTVIIESPVDQGFPDTDDSSDCEYVESQDGSKKRRRLTNLSHEEKIMRRKMKNRVAAQSARDRKKQRMSELEEAIAHLEAQNKKLLAENGSLRQCTTVLAKENVELKQQLEKKSCPMKELEVDSISTQTSVVTRTLVEPTSESAVLGTPQQWEQARPIIVQLATNCLMSYLVTLGLIFYLSCSMTLKKRAVKKEIKEEIQDTQLPEWHQSSIPSQEWWGRHQRSWNPAMNS